MAFHVAQFVADKIGVGHYALNSSSEFHAGLDFLHPDNRECGRRR